jgi:tetratricopeptide (TPR) repeat protein
MEHQTAASLLGRGWTAYREKKPKYARDLFKNALKASSADDSPAMLAEIHVAIGKVARDLKEYQPAVSHYRTAAELYRGVNHEMGLAHAVRHVADILREMNRDEEAEPFILEAIELYRDQQPLPRLDLANSLRVAALLKEQTGLIADALPLWLEARNLYREAGVDAGVAESRAHLAAAGSA